MKTWASLLLVLALPLGAETLVLPVEAITDSGRLSAAEFAERHPGIALDGTVPEAEGYFVRYRHENLTYLFGPVAERTAAERWRLDLEVIRDQAVAARPALRSSTVDLFEFRFDNAAASGPGGPGPAAGDGASSGQSGTDASATGSAARESTTAPGAAPADGTSRPPTEQPGGSPGTPGSPSPADGPPSTPGQGQSQPNIWSVIKRIFGF